MMFVIVVDFSDKPRYLQYETPGTINPKTHKTISEPQGYFCDDVKDAMKIRDEQLAIAISKAYEDSHIEQIAE